MAIYTIPSADSITIRGGLVVTISGTTTINTILGVHDGQSLAIVPSGAFSLGGAGNVSASTVAQVVGVPVILLCINGVLTQVGVRAASPTLTTPTIADFTNAQHDHQDAAGGGQITSAAISGVTGTGDVVLADNPTIDDPTITTRIRLPGPVYIYSGSGAPNFAAPKGSTFQRSDGGAGTCFYVNEDGTSGGWVAK